MRWRLLGVVALLVAAASAVAQAFAPFHLTEKPGPHPVGLKVVEQYDYSRTFRRATDEFGKPSRGERARPLLTLVWYPAEHTSATSMSVGDYKNLWAAEINFSHPNMPVKSKEWIAGINPAALAMPLLAIRDAPLAPGRFPVVIYAPGASAQAFENIDLCEFLASHGYVVVASPDMGASTRDMTIDLDGINTQAADISFLIGYARSLPDADQSGVAVAGHSWGGISNVFAAARDSRIDALVALDGRVNRFQRSSAAVSGRLILWSAPIETVALSVLVGGIQIGVQVANAFNHLDAPPANLVIGVPGFGQLTSMQSADGAGPRKIQLTGRLTF
jgi:pimeloyl-ACP methyl ester carboxylesterase